MRNIWRFFLSSFDGLSKEVWWLALITLINRAGTMVIPFLSLYLKDSLELSLQQIGWIMTAFGLGSVVGSWIGGWLTDRIGYYKVMSWSLALTGTMFILLQWIIGFWFFATAIFVIMAVADSFRPAAFVALSTYSKQENKTRSVTLIRLAINLGFAAGPAIGGAIIVAMGYSGLFWLDGVTCLIAVIVLIRVLHPKRARTVEVKEVENPVSPYTDKLYMMFFFAMSLFGLAFVQYFSTMPLFYREVHVLSEYHIGLLLGMNGLMIFILEMPLVKYFENTTAPKLIYVVVGGVLVALSFLVVNWFSFVGVLIIGMLFMTVGEMMAFPFSNAFAMDRARKGRQGQYMALYTVAFSMAHIVGHNLGMQSVEKWGYEFTWYLMGGIMIFASFLFFLLLKMLKVEK
jgi:predicted MFS family arabinose efflux permease